MSKDDGGAAFPDPDFYHGMSLRDYFAGQALAECEWPDWDIPDPRRATDEEVARRCYDIATAMVAEKRRREFIDKDVDKPQPTEVDSDCNA